MRAAAAGRTPPVTDVDEHASEIAAPTILAGTRHDPIAPVGCSRHRLHTSVSVVPQVATIAFPSAR
jgi:hypothetical protein